MDSGRDISTDVFLDTSVAPVWDTYVVSWDGGIDDIYILADIPVAKHTDAACEFPRCEAGTIEECVCFDREVGVQACIADSGIYDHCHCERP